MHGRYRTELGQYAREVASAQREREREVEESRRRSYTRQQRREKKTS